MDFGVTFLTKVIHMDVHFQTRMLLINLELYNSVYELNTKERSRPI